MSTPITSTWLRANGFHWHQLERQPSRHWLLWIGNRLPSHENTKHSSDDFGIEVARGVPDRDDWWFVWFRADYAGRYTRMICAGHVKTAEQLTAMIAGIIGEPFDADHTWGGSLRTPADIARLKSYASGLHVDMAKEKYAAITRDEAEQIRKQFGHRDWFNRVEIEDDACCVVYVNRWPTHEERKGLSSAVGIEMATAGSGGM